MAPLKTPTPSNLNFHPSGRSFVLIGRLGFDLFCILWGFGRFIHCIGIMQMSSQSRERVRGMAGGGAGVAQSATVPLRVALFPSFSSSSSSSSSVDFYVPDVADANLC